MTVTCGMHDVSMHETLKLCCWVSFVTRIIVMYTDSKQIVPVPIIIERPQQIRIQVFKNLDILHLVIDDTRPNLN